jgi:hypothetical protein
MSDVSGVESLRMDFSQLSSCDKRPNNLSHTLHIRRYSSPHENINSQYRDRRRQGAHSLLPRPPCPGTQAADLQQPAASHLPQ